MGIIGFRGSGFRVLGFWVYGLRVFRESGLLGLKGF